MKEYADPKQNTRLVYLDYLRVIATIFVIGVHTVSLAASMSAPGSMRFHILEIFNFVFLSCNLLFVMLSGALLLPVRGERTRTFFAKRFLRAALPLLVYYILYICAKEGLVWLRPDHWLPMARRILSGPPEEAPHFWLIYVILFLYLLTPILRWVVQNIPRSVLAGVLVVLFAVNGLTVYGPLFAMDFHLSFLTDSFVGVYLLGFFLAGQTGKRAEDLIIVGGILSFAVSCYLIFFTGTYGDYIYNNAPTMILFSSALFLIVKRGVAEQRTESRFIRIIGKYSFSILLIHWGVLHFVVKQLLHVNVLSGGVIGGCLLMAFLTFVFSLVGAVIIDSTLIALLLFIFRKIYGAAQYFFRKEKYN